MATLREINNDFWYFRYSFRDRIGERFVRPIANVMPRSLVYWVVMRAYVRATHEHPTKTPDDLTFSEVVKPWERPR